jgi:copper transporter 1
MLFTWNTKNLCIIFRWWHIRDFATLLFSLFAIVLLTAGYEALREASRRYEKWVEKKTEETPSKLALVLFHTVLRRFGNRLFVQTSQDCEAKFDGDNTERTPFLWSGRNQVEVSKRAHVIKAALYAFQTFYAFMLMWVISKPIPPGRRTYGNRLLFMTYNGWVMLAMFIGSFLGYLSFGGGTPATKETACH